MPRRNLPLPRALTFGGRVPAAVGLLLALMLFASVWGWLERGLLPAVVFAPSMILRGEVWRLVTWAFFQDDPFTLLFGGFMLWRFGQDLVYVWGERRLLARFFGYVVFASVASTLLATVWAPAASPHLGAWPVIDALLVSWALLNPSQQVNIWGVLPLTGQTLAYLVVGGTFLYGVFAGGIAGIGAFSLHLFAIALAWALARRHAGARGPFGEARRWWAEREQKRRARHLKVVRKRGSNDGEWLN